MRNCACRGEGSGFAHASCVAKYQKSEEKKEGGWARPGIAPCKNCNQPYIGDMEFAIATARLDLYDANEIARADYNYIKETMHIAACHTRAGKMDESREMLEECLETVQSNTILDQSKQLECEILTSLASSYICNIASKQDVKKGENCLRKAQMIAKECDFDNGQIEACKSMLDIFTSTERSGNSPLP